MKELYVEVTVSQTLLRPDECLTLVCN